MEVKRLTGFPSIDKPWLRFYSRDILSSELPECSIYQAIVTSNKNHLDLPALDYYGNKITYRELFQKIDVTAGALVNLGVKHGDIVSVCMINSPETIYLLYAINRIGAVANMISGFSEEGELVKYINDVHSTVLFVLDVFQEKVLRIIDKVNLKTVIIVNLKESMGPAFHADHKKAQETALKKATEMYLFFRGKVS